MASEPKQRSQKDEGFLRLCRKGGGFESVRADCVRVAEGGGWQDEKVEGKKTLFPTTKFCVLRSSLARFWDPHRPSLQSALVPGSDWEEWKSRRI